MPCGWRKICAPDNSWTADKSLVHDKASVKKHEAYLEGEILQADPVQLVRIMFRIAKESVAAARRHLKAGAISLRAAEISRASSIINELALSLNHEHGADLSRNLVELYSYIQHLLHEANFRQIDAPLAEAESLLQVLLEGWEGVAPAAPPAPPSGYAPLSCAW